MTRVLLIAAALAGVVAFSTKGAEADGAQEIPYTCTEPGALPDLSAPVPLTTSDSVDPAKIFQPVTWTTALSLPAVEVPEILQKIDFVYFRVHLPIPPGVHVISTRLTPPAGQTLNPPAADMSTTITATEVVIEVPKTSLQQDFVHRIRLRTGSSTPTYPESAVSNTDTGSPVVLPIVSITGVPTPAAAETTLDWQAPILDTQALGATFTCTPDEPSTITSTAVGTQRQTCDGRPVTVQVGFNNPTAAANVIQGTNGADVNVNGLGGNDRFCGLLGNDSFRGGLGNDRAFGGGGNDTLKGDAGDDRLQGDAGADTLQGGAGRDALIGGTQRDNCNGGTQRDTAQTCEVKVSIP
jgi:hypothetical protein